MAAHAPAKSRSRCSRSFASSIQPRPASGPGAVDEPAPRHPRFGQSAAPAQQPGQLDRGHGHVRIAAVYRPAGHLQASHGLIDAAFVTKEARQPDEVAGRRPAPDLAFAVAALEMGQDPARA